MTSDPENTTLISAAHAGNVKAIGKILMRYQSGIRAFLAMRLSNPHEAEDLAPEVFVTASFGSIVHPAMVSAVSLGRYFLKRFLSMAFM